MKLDNDAGVRKIRSARRRWGKQKSGSYYSKVVTVWSALTVQRLTLKTKLKADFKRESSNKSRTILHLGVE
jgi:hypothetical protein